MNVVTPQAHLKQPSEVVNHLNTLLILDDTNLLNECQFQFSNVSRYVDRPEPSDIKTNMGALDRVPLEINADGDHNGSRHMLITRSGNRCFSHSIAIVAACRVSHLVGTIAYIYSRSPPQHYGYLAISLRSLRLVANCIRKPIRHIFATIWRICSEYIRHSVRLALRVA